MEVFGLVLVKLTKPMQAEAGISYFKNHATGSIEIEITKR